MQLAALARTGTLPPTRFARKRPSTTSIWATIAEPEYGKASAINHRVAKRSAQTITTVDTGLRREEVGGIIIGVCVGLILLAVLFCCCRRRRRSWASDTESEWSVPPTQPVSQPPASTHPRPPKAAHVATSKATPLHTTSHPPPTQEKPPYAPVKSQRAPTIIPTLAANTYDNARFKSIAEKKDGRLYVEGHTGTTTGKPRIVGWGRPVRRELPTEGINTLQD